MRILVLGAGGIGGYYGGRLAAGGADVTFMVRPRRAEQLRRDGLVIKSPLGDATVPVKTVLREQAAPGWDAIILACRAWDLDDAIASIRPAAPGALIVPQLNGMRHLEVLDAAFGADNVAGGMTLVALTMQPDGTIRHLAQVQGFAHGARTPAQRERAGRLQAELVKGGFSPVLSDNILLDMWEKFAFICALASINCLLRGNVGQISRTQDGVELTQEMLAECTAVAEAAGYPPREAFVAGIRQRMIDPNSDFAASMLRDIQSGGPIEADHIVGDMLARTRAIGRPATLLRAAYAHLQAYEIGRETASRAQS
jgi:2-dehydropantoate 2-reductase